MTLVIDYSIGDYFSFIDDFFKTKLDLEDLRGVIVVGAVFLFFELLEDANELIDWVAFNFS